MTYTTSELIAKAAEAVRKMPPIVKPKLMAMKSRMVITDEGVTGELLAARQMEMKESDQRAIPDLLSYLQRETGLTRATLADILIESGRLPLPIAKTGWRLPAFSACPATHSMPPGSCSSFRVW